MLENLNRGVMWGAYRISLRCDSIPLLRLGGPTGKCLGATTCIQRLYNELSRVNGIAVNRARESIAYSISQ